MKYKMIFVLILTVSFGEVQSEAQGLSFNFPPNQTNLVCNYSMLPPPSFLLDAGVIGIYLPETIGYGDRVRPVAKIKNFGSDTVEIPARMKIGSSYNQVRNITIGPNSEDTLTFPLWAAFIEGWAMASCSTELIGDENRGNDRLLDSIYVHRFWFDIGVDTILGPDTIEPGQGFQPQAIIRNYSLTEAFDVLVIFKLYTLDTTLVFSDSIIIPYIGPDISELVSSDSITTGSDFLFSFEVEPDTNPSNDKKFKIIYVRPQAVEELQKSSASFHLHKATVMKIDQFKSHIIKSDPELKIFGINGTRIEVERVKEGIYFIKTDEGNKKVIIIK